MTLAAGKLNRRITIQRRESGTDDAGEPLDQWTTVARPWAEVRCETGMGAVRRANAQDGVAKSVTGYSFRIRYRKGLDNSMRVLCGDLILDVKQVLPDEKDRERIDLVCSEGADHGN